MNTPRQPTIEELDVEIVESQKDLDVFVQARDLLRGRARDQVDNPVEGRIFNFLTWSGTSGTLGVMDLSIHALERVIGELQEEKRKMTSPPILRLVPDVGESA